YRRYRANGRSGASSSLLLLPGQYQRWFHRHRSGARYFLYVSDARRHRRSEIHLFSKQFALGTIPTEHADVYAGYQRRLYLTDQSGPDALELAFFDQFSGFVAV